MPMLKSNVISMATSALADKGEIEKMLAAHPEYKPALEEVKQAIENIRLVANKEFLALEAAFIKELNIVSEAAYLVGLRNGISLKEAGE
jgi:hypothetical protein